jgi:hypothetical protein
MGEHVENLAAQSVAILIVAFLPLLRAKLLLFERALCNLAAFLGELAK